MPYFKTYLQVSDPHFTGALQRKYFDPWAKHVPGLPGLIGMRMRGVISASSSH